MKTNHYKQQSIKFLGFITSVCFALFLSSCGTENDESFEMPSEEVLERVAAATKVAGKYFSECNSITELKQHLDEIRSTEGVVDVWTDDLTMYVEIDGWGVINYNFPEVPDNEDISTTRFVDEETICKAFTNNTKSSSTRAVFDITQKEMHHRTNDQESPSFVIYNATYTDHRTITMEANDIVRELKALYKNDMNIETTLIENQEKSCVDFFSNDISNYDLAFIIAHGEYDNEKYFRHRIITGERIGIGESLSEDIIMEFIRSKNYWKYTARQPTDNQLNEEEKKRIREEKEPNAMLSMDCVKEKDANGNELPVYYVSLYERFFSEQMSTFNKKTIIFCTACHSLEETTILGDIFCEKGAACYLGYDNTNEVGHKAGRDFFKGLLEGWSVQSSYNYLDGDYKHDQSKNARLKIVTKNNNEEDKHVCVVHPETVSYEDGDDSVILKGSIKITNPYNNNEYGFILHSSTNATGYKLVDERIKSGWWSGTFDECKYDEGSHTFTFVITVDKSEFKDVDQFCAYLYEGKRYCLGDFKDIEIQNVQSYAEYDSGTKTLTFRYGEKPDGDNVYDIDKLGSSSSKNKFKKEDVEKVVFDESFSKTHPKSFSFKDFSSMKEIDGLQYLNTGNMTSMKNMFYDCHSLKSLDLSSFDTRNVTDMSGMFAGCSSLTSLNLRNFDTSNVTNMSDMFGLAISTYIYTLSRDHFCSSLTSLDLSSFNTNNVTDMFGMFRGCESLSALNITSFNTSNVTNMADMFWNCKSLTVLDISSFDTKNVTDMENMFSNCKNLVTIYASEKWTMENVPWDYNWGRDWDEVLGPIPMFSGCWSLVGGKGTTFSGETSILAKIDGGRGNSGYFTYKKSPN